MHFALITLLTAFSVVIALADTEVHFSPHGGCEAMVTRLITESKTTIDAAVYSLNNPRLAAALLQAHKRGVKVRLLLDRTQAGGKSNRAVIAQLLADGIDLRLHSKHRIEHNKFGVYDRRKVSTGSFNWTSPAEEKNSENCLALDESKVLDKFITQFESYLWPSNTREKSHTALKRILPQGRFPATHK